MNIKPLGDNVIIKPVSKEEVTKSGIVLPSSSDKERPEKGEVIAVGSGKIMDDGKRSIIDIKVGDNVLFKKYSADEVKIEDQELLVLSASDIIAILN